MDQEIPRKRNGASTGWRDLLIFGLVAALMMILIFAVLPRIKAFN